jgi:hypothetical protein
MWSWLAALGGIVAFFGVFWLLYRLLRSAQAREPWKRGQDSSAPPDSW